MPTPHRLRGRRRHPTFLISEIVTPKETPESATGTRAETKISAKLPFDDVIDFPKRGRTAKIPHAPKAREMGKALEQDRRLDHGRSRNE
jgi:hypothetical protein